MLTSNECMFIVVKYCIEIQIHPLEDLTYVGSGSVIKKNTKKMYKGKSRFRKCERQTRHVSNKSSAVIE